MSASTVTEPLCMLELAEGMRPVPPEPEVEPEPEQAAEATEEGAGGDADAAAAAAGAEVAQEAKPDAEEQEPGEKDAMRE